MAVNKCLKYLFFLFNLLFWISGCVILGVSIYMKVNQEKSTITNDLMPGSSVLIAAGVIIMVLGFLGCCGAIRENRCMLLLFFIFLLLIFILLVAAGILAAVGESKIHDLMRKGVEKYIPLSNAPEDVREDLNKLQTELKCCGLVNGPQDWSPPPESCQCTSTSTTTGEPNCVNGLYQTTCTDRLIELFKEGESVLLGIAFGIAALLLFGMVLSMILYCQIGKDDMTTRA